MDKNQSKISILIITGPVGIGKTTTAFEISEILEEKGIGHGFLDPDVVYVFPKPKNDPFGSQLFEENLRVIWQNFQKTGVSKLILPKVIETQLGIERIKKAIPNSKILLVRLVAPFKVISGRINKREIGKGKNWHLKRAQELLSNYQKNPIEDFTVETENRTINEIAKEILTKAGWI